MSRLQYILIFSCAYDRILDNLPLVVPVPRLDRESSFVYQHGFHVGFKGQYAGVSVKVVLHAHLIITNYMTYTST